MPQFTLVAFRLWLNVLAEYRIWCSCTYRVALPVVEYRTWSGIVLESKGVVPDVLEPFSPDAAWTGVDGQVEKAIEIVNGLEK